MTGGTVAAIDLGASSGRVMLGHVGPNELRLRPVARFANQPVRTIDGLHWNVLELYRGALDGLRTAVREEPALASIAVDSWAVDYALLRGQRMLGNPVHYRDERTAGGVAATHAVVPSAELYRENGLQFLPFNTLYQLAADRLAGGGETGDAGGDLALADTMLLIPDLITFWLTGEKVAERTNASTTGLLAATGQDVGTSQWNDALIARLGLPRTLFPRLVDPGTRVGPLLAGVAREIGADAGRGGRPQHALEVVSVGSHDTASAVVAVPMVSDSAYISSGTWSLVGVELAAPVLSDASRAATFTNEGGVDGRVRYLRNVMGLWLLSESLRAWQLAGTVFDLPTLLAEASQLSGPVVVFDVDDARFLPPGDMPARIRQWCAENDLTPPATAVALVRSIVESLAAAYAVTLRAASELSGARIRQVHIVGGGSQNELLFQLTSNQTGLPVFDGPVEATAIGNVLVQARVQGLVTGDLESLRALVARAYPPRRYDPEP